MSQITIHFIIIVTVSNILDTTIHYFSIELIVSSNEFFWLTTQNLKILFSPIMKISYHCQEV